MKPAPTPSVTDLVRSSVLEMEGKSGSITLHIWDGRVTKIEKVEFRSTATMPFDQPVVTP